MRYRLRDGVSVCIVGGRPVFLDMRQDRYVLLTPDREQDFLRLCSGEPPTEDWGDSPLLVEAGAAETSIFSTVGLGGTLRDVADIDLDIADIGTAPLYRVAAAIWRQAAIGREIRRRPLWLVIDRLRLRKAFVGYRTEKIEQGSSAFAVVSAFHRARRIRSARQKCLSESIALVEALNDVGFYPDLMFGVKLRPFEAHCWVQAGRLVLNDLTDQIRTYTPIFAL